MVQLTISALTGIEKYVINLDSDEQRSSDFQRRFAGLGGITRFPGLDIHKSKAQLSDDEKSICYDWLEKYPGTCGCLVSHYRLWKLSIATNSPIMVFEDDTAPTDGFSNGLMFLERAFKTVRTPELIFLSSENRNLDMEASSPIYRDNLNNIVRYSIREGLRQGGRCYIIWPTGASFLIQKLREKSRVHEKGHVDVFMFRNAADMDAWNLVPNLVRHADHKISRRDDLDRAGMKNEQ
jgi:GR25 family glycosyltransferase involved in LPS biosynthesis